MFKTIATIKAYPTWLVAYVDKNIADYYRSLIPKYVGVKPPKYNPHVTIVRKSIEKVEKQLNKYDGESVSIEYSGEIKCGGSYYWLDCYSVDIENIRKELGLLEFRAGFDRFHITIGNTKNDR